jgi:hypothetical protein
LNTTKIQKSTIFYGTDGAKLWEERKEKLPSSVFINYRKQTISKHFFFIWSISIFSGKSL